MLCLQELLDLQQEKKQLQQTCEEQEQALQEMGLHLSQLVFLSPPHTACQVLTSQEHPNLHFDKAKLKGEIWCDSISSLVVQGQQMLS